MRATILAALLLPLVATAQDLPPRPAIAYQGRVLSAGQPLNGPSPFTFTIVSVAGEPLWTSGSVTLTVTNGLYAVTLGGASMPEIPATILGRAGLRLRVQVGATVLTPDFDLVPALQARSAFQFTGALDGDVQGTQEGTVVMSLQGKPLDLLGTPPAAGQALVFDGGRWVAGSVAGTPGPSGPVGPPGASPFQLVGSDAVYADGAVGVGGEPAPSAALDVQAVDKGLLVPRLSAAQRAAIPAPATGLLVYQLDAPAGFHVYTGTAWVAVSGTSSNVTSVGAAAPLSSSGGSSPTISLGLVPITLGGTGATDASAARANIGAAPVVSPTFLGTVTAPLFSGDLSGNATTATTARTATSANTAAVASHANTAKVAESATTAQSAQTAVTAQSALTAAHATAADSALAAKTAQSADAAAFAANAGAATTAQSADTAAFATNAGAATTAQSAQTAVTAQSALTAGHATTADSALAAQSAQTAAFAQSADTAVSAMTAESANTAKIALMADTANFANTADSVLGVVAVAHGGTGATDAAAARAALGAAPVADPAFVGAVGIGGQADPSAALDVQGNSRGLLVPRLTAEQRLAIAAPATGLLVYQLDGPAGFHVFTGTDWVAVSGITSNVTAVTASGPLSSSGGATPNLTLGVVPLTLGGTGATDATGARAALGAASASNPVFTGTVTAPVFVGELTGNAASATIAGHATTADSALAAQSAQTAAFAQSADTAVAAMTAESANTAKIALMADTANFANTADSVSGVVAVAHGGTGATDAAAARAALGAAPVADPVFTGTVSAPAFSGDLTAAVLQLLSATPGRSITLGAPLHVAAPYTLLLPAEPGAAGQYLATDGNGALGWTVPPGGVGAVTASSPLSSSGGATPNLSLGVVPLSLGGTGATDAPGALVALGAAPISSPSFTGTVRAPAFVGNLFGTAQSASFAQSAVLADRASLADTATFANDAMNAQTAATALSATSADTVSGIVTLDHGGTGTTDGSITGPGSLTFAATGSGSSLTLRTGIGGSLLVEDGWPGAVILRADGSGIWSNGVTADRIMANSEISSMWLTTRQLITDTLEARAGASFSGNAGMFGGAPVNVYANYDRLVSFYDWNFWSGEIGSIAYSAGGVLYNTTSDVRLKENIRPTSVGLAELLRLEVKDYTFRASPDGPVRTGFLAQDLNAVYPQAVTVGGDDPATKPWQVDYGKLTPLIVRAVQELAAENQGLASRLEAQQGELDSLRAQLAEVLARLPR